MLVHYLYTELKTDFSVIVLTEKEKDFLTDYEYSESNFYGLPKIHKSRQIKEAIKSQCSEYIICPYPEDLTFRPIVGGPSAPTQRLSHLLDILLKPLCSGVKSYVRDDFDFLRHLPERVENNSKLVTLDVINLYSNISSSLGLEAVDYWISKNPEKINGRFTKDFISEATEIVLSNNTFAFNGKHFKQIKGTAMGTKMAPTYATLTLGYLEEKMYKKVEEQFNEEVKLYITNNWKRYLDDCFIVWKYSNNELSTFKTLLNELNPDIRFTAEESTDRIPFLDIMVIKENDVILTDIYYKPTDTHQYLHFNSCHPRHTKRAIPYNLARRICTIVNKETTKIQRLQELKEYLRKQSYPEKIIDNAIKKAMDLDREDLLNPVQQNKTDSRILPLVTTHNPQNTNVAPIVYQLNDVLKTDETMSKIFKNRKFINSRRQPKNLRRILTKSSFKETTEFHVTKCQDPRCGTCPYIRQGQSFNFNGKQFTVNNNMSCQTRNVIYVITCSGCGELYIGETGSTLRERIRVHKQQINVPQYRKLKVSEHLDVCGKRTFTVFPFYKLHNSNTIERRDKERHFIRTFKPKLNSLM